MGKKDVVQMIIFLVVPTKIKKRKQPRNSIASELDWIGLND